METGSNLSWMSTAGRRTVIVTSLIAVLTLFWVLLLVNVNVPALALGAFALASVLLLAVASAWAAFALPHRNADSHG